MSATPLYIKGGHTNMAAVGFNYACQMRYPVNYSFQISGPQFSRNVMNCGATNEYIHCRVPSLTAKSLDPIQLSLRTRHDVKADFHSAENVARSTSRDRFLLKWVQSTDLETIINWIVHPFEFSELILKPEYL